MNSDEALKLIVNYAKLEYSKVLDDFFLEVDGIPYENKHEGLRQVGIRLGFYEIEKPGDEIVEAYCKYREGTKTL